MNMERVVAAVGSVAALTFGVHAIVTRRLAFGEEGDDQVWYYGWRAVAGGCVALAVGAYFLAGALAFVELKLE